LIDAGLDIQFATENYDLRSRGGRLSADIQAVVAADFIRNLRDEVKKGILGRINQGRYPRPAPIGYLNMGKGIKEPDPIQGALVRQAFEMYATGNWSIDRLVDEMERRGLRNTAGSKVSRNGMSILLNNPFYTGIIRINSTGQLFPGAHTPLISKYLFDHVQGILKGKLADHLHKHLFVFSRMVQCQACSYNLSGEVQKGHTYYRCHAKNCVQSNCFREETIEDGLLRKLDAVWFKQPEEQYFLKRFEEFCANMETTQAAHCQNLQLQLEQTTTKLDRLADAYTDGVLNADVTREKQNILLARKKDIEQSLKGANRSQQQVIADRMKQFFELAKSAPQSYKEAFPEEKRDLVKTTTSNLQVSGKNVLVQLSFPFSDLEICPKTMTGSPERDVVRTWDALFERLYGHCADARVLMA
jgi:site-specific DNA recombinase